jgi:hypothetical protein
MSTPGFASDDAGLRRRGQAVADVAATLRDAAAAADAAGAPDAFGLLCGFFPALLDPVAREARAALVRAAEGCDDTAREVGAAGTAFTDTDDAGAAGFGR